MAKNTESGLTPLTKGVVYKNKESGEEVVVFLVEPNGTVAYAPMGSAREVRTNAQDFLAAFELSKDALQGDSKAQKNAEAQRDAAIDNSVAVGNKFSKDGVPVDPLAEVKKNPRAIPKIETDKDNQETK